MGASPHLERPGQSNARSSVSSHSSRVPIEQRCSLLDVRRVILVFRVHLFYVTMAPAKTQNTVLARGINMISSNTLAAKNGRFNFYGKGPQKKAAPAPVAETKTSKWYPADNIPTPVASAKTARNCKKTAKLRASIVPGTILILLSGRFRGKRVVFLKQLKSGALLITGRSFCVLKGRSGSMMKTYTWRGRAESRWFLL